MLPLRIFSKKFDSQFLDYLEQEIMACCLKFRHHDDQGVWIDKGLVAEINHWDWYDDNYSHIKTMLYETLQPIIGDFQVSANHILDSRLPWDIHNDYVTKKDNNNLIPYCAIMIPLVTVPAQTIFFNQWAPYKEFIKYKNENSFIKDHVPVEQWKNLLGHCRINDRFYLSIDTVYEWQRGDLVIFDCKQWHASNDYREKIANKKAIIIFTCKE